MFVKLSVTVQFEISYSHFLPEYDGNCRNLHGHNGIIELEFAPTPQYSCSYPGMVCDFKTIKKECKPIIDQLDHTHLNDLPEFETINPTAENICRFLFSKIKKLKFGAGLVRVRVYETSNCYAELKTVERD